MFIGLSIVTLMAVTFLSAVCVNNLVKKNAAKFLFPERSLPSTSPADYGFYYEEIRFHSADGLELGGWFIPARRADKSTILFVHGLRGNRGSLLVQATQLLERGYGAFFIDLRNHGTSQGSITTMTAQEIFDIEGAITYLTTRADVNAGTLGIIGHSLGAAAIRAATRQPEIKYVIAQAAFADLCESMHQAARMLTGLRSDNKVATALIRPFVSLMIRYAKKKVGHEPETISPVRELKQMPAKPMLFMHGLEDKTISACNSEQLFEHARGEKELILLEGTGHSSFRNQDYHTYIHSVIRFVEQNTQTNTSGLFGLASLTMHQPYEHRSPFIRQKALSA